MLFVAFALVRGNLGARIAAGVPAGFLIGLQGFRVGVELILHSAHTLRLAPRMLTFEGANVDILIGLSAPILGWLVWRRDLSSRWSLLWNVLGLLSLLNVITRSALTAPGPLHLLATELPNLVIGTFPTTFIAGFFAPLAVAFYLQSGLASAFARPGWSVAVMDAFAETSVRSRKRSGHRTLSGQAGDNPRAAGNPSDV